MKKSVYLSISTLTILSSFVLTPTVNAQDYNNIDDAKKAHPNAQFNINASDGSFTYTYGQPERSKQQPNMNLHQSNISDTTHTTETTPQTLPNSQTIEEQPAPSNETPLPETMPTQPDTSIEDHTNQQVGDVDKAYEKDKDGMITSIDLDTLNDELQISEFNEKAKTVDGKPLALGNGKIIDQPTFTNKNNLYTAGQCTWYVFDKRAQDARTISTFWGDAKHWAGQASAAGFKVDNQPEKGAILQTVAGAYGHVAYVENVNSDGSLLVSEMNWIGPYIISTRTISASEAGTYNYIH